MILINGKSKIKVGDRGTGMNAHQYGRPAPDQSGFIPTHRAIGELLDDLGYELSEIGEVLDYVSRNGTVEGFPFFRKPWHREIIERMLPDTAEDQWSVYDSWRWGTV